MQGVVTDNAELKKLIIENPNLPLLIFVTEDANSGEWSVELASCGCSKGIVLDATKDCWLPRDDRIYTDASDLEEDIRNALDDEDEYKSLSDKEFYSVVAEKVKALEPYWKECIIVTVYAF